MMSDHDDDDDDDIAKDFILLRIVLLVNMEEYG